MMDMNLKNELADKLKKEAEHFSGAQDLVEMLLDAEAMIRNLHTENTALRVTEDNLRQELQECQDQRRAAFRRIEELDAMRAQIGQCEPVAWRWTNIKTERSGVYLEDPTLFGVRLDHPDYEWAPLYTHPAPQQKPLTDGQIEQISQQIERSDFFDCVIPFARAIEAAHGITKE